MAKSEGRNSKEFKKLTKKLGPQQVADIFNKRVEVGITFKIVQGWRAHHTATYHRNIPTITLEYYKLQLEYDKLQQEKQSPK